MVTTRLSVNSNGIQANNNSYHTSISSNARYIAYWSEATNLLPGDTNLAIDIFYYDTVTKKTSRVSVDNNGIQGNGQSVGPSISSDGRYVSYWSEATNLVPGDTNNTRDIFVYDTLTKKNKRVSLSSSGIQGNNHSIAPSLGLDGRYVTYLSYANNLVSGDTNGSADIFFFDSLTNKTTRVSADSNGIQGNADSLYPKISGNGQYITYYSNANNLVPGDTNGVTDIFLYNTISKKTTRINVKSNGIQANAPSFDPSIGENGRYIVYKSLANNLVPGDTNNKFDIFVYDTLTSTTRRASVASNGIQSNGHSHNPSLSGNGTIVVFESEANNLVPGDTNNTRDIFVHNLVTKTTNRISVNSNTAQSNGNSYLPSLSADGSYVGFHSDANNLVSGDTNGSYDTFLTNINFNLSSILTFWASNYSVQENGLPLVPITINRTANISGVATVLVTPDNGSAIAPGDFSNTPITITFASGQTVKTLAIPIVNDRLIEPNEKINLRLSNPTGATLGFTTTAVLTIIENDTATAINQTGTAGVDSLIGLTGNDTLTALKGNDYLTGLGGNDFLTGNEGNDLLDGNTANDSLYGNEGNDTLAGKDGNDLLNAGDGIDNLQGEAGNDTLDGGVGSDSLDGGEGNDDLYGVLGNDFLNGRGGNDSLNAAVGNDTLNGEIGNDSLQGGKDNDILTGYEGNDTLLGGEGNDYLDGYTGNDSLDGGEGNDTLLGGEGNDTLNGWIGNDTLNGGNGNDELSGWLGNNTLDGGKGNDTLNGAENNDLLVGGLGSDRIIGVAGNDTIDGAAENDFLTGGQGNDSLSGGDGSDTLTGYGNVEGELDDLDGGNTGNDLYVLDYNLGLGITSNSDTFESRAVINLNNVSKARIRRMKKTDKIKVKSGNYAFQPSGNNRLLYRILPSSSITTNREFAEDSFEPKATKSVLLATIVNNSWINNSYLIF